MQQQLVCLETSVWSLTSDFPLVVQQPRATMQGVDGRSQEGHPAL